MQINPFSHGEDIPLVPLDPGAGASVESATHSVWDDLKKIAGPRLLKAAFVPYDKQADYAYLMNKIGPTTDFILDLYRNRGKQRFLEAVKDHLNDDQKAYFAEQIEGVILHALVNAIKERNGDGPQALADLSTAFIYKLFEPHFNEVNTDILKIAFPQGAKEMPFWAFLQQPVYDGIRASLPKAYEETKKLPYLQDVKIAFRSEAPSLENTGLCHTAGYFAKLFRNLIEKLAKEYKFSNDKEVQLTLSQAVNKVCEQEGILDFIEKSIARIAELALNSATCGEENAPDHLINQAIKALESKDPAQALLEVVHLDSFSIIKEPFTKWLDGQYQEFTKWIKEKDDLKKATDDRNKSQYFTEGARVLSAYTNDLILHTVKTSEDEKVGEAVSRAIPGFFPENSEKSIGEGVKKHVENAPEFIKKQVENYTEAAYLKIFDRLSNLIEGVEKKEGKETHKFLTELMGPALDLTTKHLNQVKKASSKKKAWQMNKQELREAFGSRLHRGMKEESRKQVFEEIVDKLLQLTGIDEIPIPKEYHDQVFKKLKTDILPDVLDKIYSKMASPLVMTQMATNAIALADEVYDEALRNQYQLNLVPLKQFLNDFDLSIGIENLQGQLNRFEKSFLPVKEVADAAVFSQIHSLYDDLEELKKLEKKGADQTPTLERIKKKNETFLELVNKLSKPLEENEEDKLFNKQCLNLVKSLIGLVPNSLTKPLLRLQYIEGITEDAMGRAARDFLVGNSLIKLIDKGIKSGLPALHPGEWDGEKFVSDGPLKFDFTENKEKEKATLKEYQERFYASYRKEWRKGLNGAVRSTVLAPWTFTKRSIEKAIKKACGAQINLDKLFFFLEKTIDFLFYLISITFGELFWFFWEKVYVNRKARQSLKSVTMDIHENLIFELTDLLLNKLQENK